MKKSILEIYALAVCFFTVACFVVTLGIAGFSLVRIVKPDFSIGVYEFKQYQSNDAYWQSNRSSCCGVDEDKKEVSRPSEEELTKKRMESYAETLQGEQHEGLKTLINCLIVLLIDAVTFGAHWWIAKRARASAA